MAEEVVLVNGLPGVGKSTLATTLASRLDVELIAKDVLKERLATNADAPSPEAVGAVASELVWSLAAQYQGRVILDSWWYRPRDLRYAAEGLRRSGALRAVEV